MQPECIMHVGICNEVFITRTTTHFTMVSAVARLDSPLLRSPLRSRPRAPPPYLCDPSPPRSRPPRPPPHLCDAGLQLGGVLLDLLDGGLGGELQLLQLGREVERLRVATGGLLCDRVHQRHARLVGAYVHQRLQRGELDAGRVSGVAAL